ncbi:UDP-N-acetylmuramate--L-alanine ligase [Tenacibaculum sp. 190524A02b]|uniref:UDP-N-acetylmuramate--L-alanine ligase n=1 Tax=Tenacibaculum vairaonense TaxID=3137860 RepID=UPI0032B249F1
MELRKIENIYFVGIGGIGMSAIARYFAVHGKNVAGYDKVATPITDALLQIDVAIHFEDAVKNIPLSFLNKEVTVVVYTPAIPSSHQELSYFKSNDYLILKRSEILGEITKDTFCLAVAGTHGKTTTSSILGHIMQSQGGTSFLGGIAENYNSNLILGESEVSVVEADEFDRSFLKLSPDIACITSMDADHLDIYGEEAFLEESFRDFSAKVNDVLIVAKGLPLDGITYAIEEDAGYEAYDVQIVNGSYLFNVKTPTKKIENLTFSLPGRHNLMNALAALAMADVYGVSEETIKEQLKTFKGVKRRFSYKIKTEDVVLIDDYAHHPTEIKAVEASVRELYPEEEVLAVFQPHLFSRTRDFIDDFAKELSKFDEVVLLDIYPARELPIEGVTSSWLLNKMTIENKQLVSKEKMLEKILKTDKKIIVMLGAGDIGLMIEEAKEKLVRKFKAKV